MKKAKKDDDKIVRLPKEEHKKAKVKAAQKGISIKEYLAELVRQAS